MSLAGLLFLLLEIGRVDRVNMEEGAEAKVIESSILSYYLFLLVLSSGAAGGGCWTLLLVFQW